MNFGPDPWRQTSWDARAAANFMAGGAGAGLVFATTLAGGPRWLFGAGAALVALGLLSVFSEMGRPWRARPSSSGARDPVRNS
jgi:phenylacetyl-CoA:acceptor oxidoreductase subunit 2